MSKTIMTQICHCGHTEDNHRFRHVFTPVARVNTKTEECEIKEKKETRTFQKQFYSVLLDKIPVTTKTVCSVENCNVLPGFHKEVSKEELEKLQEQEEQLVKLSKFALHAYKPVERSFREIKFLVPFDANCHVCGRNISLHSDKGMETHRFTTKILFVGKSEKNDVFTIIHPEDEDKKIVYE